MLSLAESGDIYVNNTASFGYDPSGIPPGYLRLKAGETDFDPDYFFSIGELDLRQEFPEMDPSLAKSPYVYTELMSNGKLYATMLVLGLTTGDLNDFIGNKNYQPFEFDLENQTVAKLDMLPTNGWSAQIAEYNGEVVFAESTVDGSGLYKLGQKTPFMAIEGFPVHVAEVDQLTPCLVLLGRSPSTTAADQVAVFFACSGLISASKGIFLQKKMRMITINNHSF
ncbi:MAG TPA: hypothetical protein DD979_11335 [Gammaproteobacteria bacterium]|nr:hypothetical protein [Gammaproteobacteria bacterium]